PLSFFPSTPSTASSTLSLHDALPISILHTGDTVVVAEDFSVPGSTVVRSSTRGIVESDPAWDEDSCDPDRPISLRLASGELVSVDRKSTRLNSSHVSISYAVFCLKKK